MLSVCCDFAHRPVRLSGGNILSMYMWNFMESHNYVARYPREYPVFFRCDVPNERPIARLVGGMGGFRPPAASPPTAHPN